MKISYIPPATSTPKNLLQSAIEDAINNTIVIPFKTCCYEVVYKGIMLAEWGVIFGCAAGIIFWVCGIKKGKKTAIVCALVFIGIQVVKVVFIQ